MSRRLTSDNSESRAELRLLEKIARAMVQKQELRPVMQMLAESLVRDFGFRVALLTEFNPALKGFTVLGMAPLGIVVRTAAKFLGVRLEKLVFPYRPDKNAILKLLGKNKTWIGTDFGEILRPMYPVRAARLIQKAFGVRCIYNSPLFSGTQFLGTMVIGTDQGSFSARQLTFLKTFTHQAALVVHQAALLAEKSAAARQYKLLGEVDSRILEEKELRKVLRAIVMNINRVIPCDLAGIYLHDPGREVMVHSVAWPLSRYAKSLKDLEFPIGRGIIGSVAKSWRAEIVNNAHLDPRSVYPRGLKPSLEHLLCLPLVANRTLMGVLHIGRFRDEPFSESDLEVARQFGGKSALAIENAQLHASLELEVKKIRLLRDIKALARRGSSAERFLHEVCDLVVHAYGYHLTCVLLYDPVRQVLKLAAASGSEAANIPADYEQSIQDGVVGWVARTRKTRLVQDSTTDEYFINRNNLSTRSELCIPILDSGKNLIGVINTESNRAAAFTATDVQTLSAVASEMAGAFEEQRLLTALGDSEQKFRRLFEESKDAIYISTLEGGLLDVNQAAVDLFGYADRDELMRVDIRRDLYVDPRDRDDLIAELDARGFLKDVELRLKKKSGHRLLVHATITMIRDASGRAVALQGILHDITRQKDDEQRLHESEEKYRSLVEDSLAGVYIIQDGRFAFVNSRFGEIFGYSVAEAGSRSVEDFVHPDDRGLVLENIRKRIAEETRSLRYGFRGIRRDGSIIEVEVFGTRSVYQGRPAVIGTILDRTQEHRQRKEIDEWKKRYELIIASSAQVVYEYNVRTGAILWGGTIEEVLGYKLPDLRGDVAEWEEFIHPEDRERALRELDAALSAKRPYDEEYRFRRKDGTYAWMHDRGFVVTDDTGWARVMLGMMEDVTQSRLLEEKLNLSELKHRLLFEHANDAVIVLKGELITDCNPRAQEMFGCAKEDIIGQTLYAFTPPYQVNGQESKAALMEHMKDGVEGRPQKFSWRHIRRDGSGFDAEVRMNRFELAGETLVQVQIRDITAEVEAQEELARSEEVYRRLILEASDPILVSDGDGKFVEVNEAACTLLGYSREELLHLNASVMSTLSREEAVAEYRRFYARLMVEERVFVPERLLKRKDGSQFPVETSAVLLGNGLLQAIIRDISEKKQAEQELDKIYTLATTYRGQELFDRAAAALAEMLGMAFVSVGEIHGAEVRSLTLFVRGRLHHDTTHPLAGSPCERILTEKSSCFYEQDAAERHPEDPTLKEWAIKAFVGVPMFDSRREVIGIMSLMDDRPHRFSEHEKRLISVIAQRVASEIENLAQKKQAEQLSEQLVQSQKMESLGTLAGGVAHDFNNILGAVLGYTALIKKRVQADEQTARYLDAIEKSAQRAASLSKQLLSFSHKTQGEIQPVPVNDLIRDTIHIIASSFPKDIAIETRLADTIPPVLGDQNLLGQVVMNLCINARDAVADRRSPGEGRIVISTSPFTANAGFIDVHLSAAPGSYVCLTVSDNGCGMKPEVRSRIFEPFFTTKGKGRGTGLGLSMVYGIVRNHNGFIDVHTDVDKGTEFRVFLPAAPVDGEVATETVLALPQGNGELVMVVEDEPMLRDLVADVLQGQGFSVVVASNGKEAVELYKDGKEKIRLVVLDMIMPEMDGQAAFRALRALNPNVKILISSGFSQDNAVQRLLSEGAAGFVGKPYQTEDIVKAVASNIRD